MKIYLLLLFTSLTMVVYSQSIDDLSFGTDSTFDVATWNIEQFPKSGQGTINYVTEFIYALDLEYIAMQEVDNPAQFESFIAQLEGYEGFYQENEYARLGVIYKSDGLIVNDLYQIFTTFQYWSAFSRPPIVMEVEFMGVDYVLINNHFKCCGDGILDTGDADDEEYRRRAASIYLKTYIDDNFANENVIVLGDLNDILTDDEANNVFQNFLDDSENYVFADMDIATSASENWSYPTWPSHLDHILVSNELFDELENTSTKVECIKLEDYLPGGWNTYESDISDHRPVALSFVPNIPVGLDNIPDSQYFFGAYPNPVRSSTRFQFEILRSKGQIKIYDALGREADQIQFSSGSSEIFWNAERYPAGIYVAHLMVDGIVLATTKVVKR